MTHLIFTFVAILIAAWNLAPLVVLAGLPIPVGAKLRAAMSLLASACKGLLVLLPDLLAPLVVPIALLQTRREDDHLPAWASWWDNDVSINGDQPEGAQTYYAPGHDRRSFWARFVWLGLRNRASALAVRLGHTYAPGEYDDAQSWGDPGTGRDHEGWSLNRRGPVWQLYVVKRLSMGLCLRVNYGYKVWGGPGDRRPVAMVVNIACSFLSWEGGTAHA